MVERDLHEQVRILRDEVGIVVLDREVVLATGEGVVDYLQGQLSQDVAALEPGHSAWSFILQPQGKVDAWFRISRLDVGTFVIDIDAGWADVLIARLERFRLRTPVTFERADWNVIAVRGAAAPPPAPPTDPARGVVVPVGWPGNHGWDLIADAAAVSLSADLAQCSLDAAEVLRIEAGIPRMGNELDESTIPAEAGAAIVARSVSFTKGCFTGQELVARIDSRGGQVPRRLVGVVSSSLVAGATLRLDGAEVGRVTSVAPASSIGEPVGLAYLARKVEAPAELDVVAPDGSSGGGRVLSLPLASSTTV